MVKKLGAEFLGTAVLVFMGCLAASLLDYISLVGVALVFGMVLTVLAYSIGGLSGCHVNPAVTIGMLAGGRIKVLDAVLYIVCQIAGAFFGAWGVWNTTGPALGMGVNHVDPFFAPSTGLGLEIVLTFVFVFAVLRITADEKLSTVAPLGVGVALTLVHLVGIDITGTSVNPARSLAPSVFLLFGQGTELGDLWIFMVGPMVGGLFAGLLFFFLNYKKKDKSGKADA